MRKVRFLFLYGIFLALFGFTVAETGLRNGIASIPLVDRDQLDEKLKLAASQPMKVMLFGDSFMQPAPPAYGMGNLLEQYFKDRGATCFNLARGGTGPLEYLKAFRAHAPTFKPDLIIVNYYVGNDVTDTLREYEATLRYLQTPDTSLLEQFYLVDFVRAKLKRMEYRRRFRAIDRYIEEGGDKFTGVLNPWLVEMGVENPNYLLDNLFLEGEALQDAWKLNQKILQAFIVESSALGSKVLFVLSPRSVQIGRSHYAFFANLGIRTDDRFLTTATPQDRLMEFCAEQEAVCLNLLPKFRQNPDVLYYIPNDDHLNAEGARFAFQQVREYLDASGLEP
jgi:hypothetical protein